MRVFASVSGVTQLQTSLKSIQKALQGALVDIVKAGALPIEDAAKINAPVVTGALRDSISTDIVSQSPSSVRAVIMPHVPYGARIEYGFIGADSLGRNYHQPAEPYMRPAFESEKANALEAMREVAKETIDEAMEANFSQRADAARARRS